jgi:hypothetical protein
MEVYILDSLYRRVQVCDSFDSLIWTERCRRYGDFQLTVHSTPANRARFTVGTNLAMNESYRVMTVETVEDTTDDEGRKLLNVSGRSLEAILLNRIAHGTISDDLTTTPKWTLTGLPLDLLAYMYHYHCVLGTLDAGDIIANVAEGSELFPEDTIGAPSDTITIDIEPATLYDSMANLADIYDMGFRIVRDPVSSLLYFDTYMGCDRTTDQTTLPAVVFAPELDNLQKVTELQTIASYKNVAYVFSPVGVEVVYADGVDPEVAGFDRHVLLVKADDITDTDAPTASAKMIQRGKDELAANRRQSAFDGELDQNAKYKYGIDYNLGDLTEMRNQDGVTNKMQVTEQIFVSDSEGEKSYPTLALNTFITPGSWLAWDYNQEWADLDPSPETWADQP